MNWATMEERLLSKCEKTDTCWNWLGATRNGYGRMQVETFPDGSRRYLTAHRAAYIEWKGEITKPMILHTCDNRRCINPDHLYNGTHQDNVRDAVERDRFRRPVGEDHGRAIITNDAAKTIKRLLATTDQTCRQIADSVGCSRGIVKSISCGQSWRDVLSAETPLKPRELVTV